MWPLRSRAGFEDPSETKNPKRLNELTQRANRAPQAVVKIYKICPASAWREAERQGVYRGSADDTRDGFIHFSTAAQVPETLRKHFLGQRALFLVEVDDEVLGAGLRWERSRNGELFPHLYGELDLGAVIAVTNLNMRADGSHDIPELLP
ncbi:uncharacterized protein (DUF952 family) [Bradyrhizobium sp. LM2.7]